MYKDQCNASISIICGLEIVQQAAWTKNHQRKNAQTHADRLWSNAMEDKQNRPIYTSVRECVCVCSYECVCRKKSSLWSFCTESMKQAWLLNRVFNHFGLW